MLKLKSEGLPFQPSDIIVVLVIISLPLSVKFNGLSIIIFIVYTIFYCIRYRPKHNFNLLYFFCIPFLFDIIGLFYSTNLNEGIEFVTRRLSILIFPILFTIFPVSKKKVNTYCYVFTLLCASLGLICLISAISQQIHWSILYDKREINWFIFSYHHFASAISIHAVYFSLYVGFSIVFLSLELVKEKRLFFNRKILIIILVFNFLILFLLSSRMAVAITILCFLGIINHYLWKREKLIAVVVNISFLLVLILVFSQFTILRERFVGVFKKDQETEYIQKWDAQKGNISVREQKWQGAFLVIKDHPLLGIGTGDLEPALMKKYEEINFLIGIENKFDPHNQFLNTTARTGILSGLTFLLVFFVPMLYSLKKQHFLYFGFLFLVFCISITESVLSSQKGIVFYSLFNSLLFSSIYKK